MGYCSIIRVTAALKLLSLKLFVLRRDDAGADGLCYGALEIVMLSTTSPKCRVGRKTLISQSILSRHLKFF